MATRGSDLPQPTKAILGFAANGRFIGVAGLQRGSARLLSRRVVRAESTERRRMAIELWFIRFRPAVAILIRDDAPTSGRSVATATAEFLRDVAARFDIRVIEFSRLDVANRLGIDAVTTAAFCREMARREPSVAKLLTTRRNGQRTDRDRHREMSVVALAGVRAAAQLLAEIDRRTATSRS